VIADQLLETYRALASGATDRDAAAAWVASLDRRAVSVRDTPDPGLWWDALATLGAVTSTGSNLFDIDDRRRGPPYFVRDRDIEEWLANLTQVPLESSSAGVARRFRIWQAPATVRPDVATIGGIFEAGSPAGSLRGVDDLDYFEELALVLPSGRIALLRHHRGAPPDSTTVHLQFDDGKAESALSEVLAVLQLSDQQVGWRSETYFKTVT
jgi:hypothetical protein